MPQQVLSGRLKSEKEDLVDLQEQKYANNLSRKANVFSHRMKTKQPRSTSGRTLKKYLVFCKESTELLTKIFVK